VRRLCATLACLTAALAAAGCVTLTPPQQHAVIAALEFKCSVLWAMLDALYHAYVAPKHVPPGAFAPKAEDA